MELRLPRVNYGAIVHRMRNIANSTALHPYLRFLVFVLTFLALFAAVTLDDSALPRISSPPNGPSGDRAWRDLQIITQQPHPFNSRQNDLVRNYILSEMNKGRGLR